MTNNGVSCLSALPHADTDCINDSSLSGDSSFSQDRRMELCHDFSGITYRGYIVLHPPRMISKKIMWHHVTSLFPIPARPPSSGAWLPMPTAPGLSSDSPCQNPWKLNILKQYQVHRWVCLKVATPNFNGRSSFSPKRCPFIISWYKLIWVKLLGLGVNTVLS